MTSTDVIVSVNSALIVAIVYLAIQVSKLAQRIARLEERTEHYRRRDEDD